MAGRTARFRFNKFGGGVPGTIGDDASKFTSLDRDLMDSLFAQIESHDHKFRLPHSDLTNEPSLVLEPGAGDLDAGVTYYYCYSLVDAFGVETMPSPMAEITLPDLLEVPDPPVAYVDEGNSEGNLEPGLYYYVVTALRDQEESVISDVETLTLSPEYGAITIELPEYGEADGFRIWRMRHTDPGYTPVGVVNVPTAVFVDDGSVEADPCACDPENMPPTSFNRGMSDYAVEVSLPSGLSLDGFTGWRLYRTTIQGAAEWPTASLVHQIVEREDEYDPESPLLRSYLDTGEALSPGRPQEIIESMQLVPFTFDTKAELPNPAPYPAGYPLLVGRKLYVKVGSAWELVAGGGAGGMGQILTAPDGGRWVMSVDSSGNVVTTPTAFPGPPTPPQNVQIEEV